MRSTIKVKEVDRVMTICNACRYCEGHCAVFQAMELRLEFNSDDLDYLSNLCHNCGACYHNCQYAKPHEFELNVPGAMAELREESYAQYAWPSFMGSAFKNNGLWVTSLLLVLVTAFVVLGAYLTGDSFFQVHDNAFYGVISHNVMVGIFGTVALFVAIAMVMSIVNFWKVMRLPAPWKLDWGLVAKGIKDGLTLKYLDGGNGQGCSYPSEKPSMARRYFHQMTFWGFMLCFAATSTATVMHYALALPAPYDFISLPKLFGVIGGLGLIVGPIGLMALKRQAVSDTKGKTNKGMDTSFLMLLLLTSVSGLGLMVLRDTSWVGLGLTVHLGIVLTLFISMPYGKFVHGFYRLIALITFVVEKERHQAIVGVKPVTEPNA
ncbi:tricarballylate utilization 4Fe-4S protein TcuB [Vibrio sp. SCSIO 43140]|uniref:tricarballylate utilization 4Fe-4S protein TcuB n=1 Tax=Vibrio sp. SCSIO 43140 TaxID=2819100 RepID=UPI00207544A4|nr:tricarballylate utilization 4Fe-4S protein TcuB [Vibrio sp. SCSIO 43140]USD62465.1 tricarballylate utilization 4Fe-4S protein TcuB [Vibrio sp. SCSIO 43140]